jgi:hypothetical protein
VRCMEKGNERTEHAAGGFLKAVAKLACQTASFYPFIRCDSYYTHQHSDMQPSWLHLAKLCSDDKFIATINYVRGYGQKNPDTN